MREPVFHDDEHWTARLLIALGLLTLLAAIINWT